MTKDSWVLMAHGQFIGNIVRHYDAGSAKGYRIYYRTRDALRLIEEPDFWVFSAAKRAVEKAVKAERI